MRPLVASLGIALLSSLWAEPAGAVDLSAELGIVSDYRYRGYTLSAGKPALQGSLTLEHGSGAYASIWSSTIDEPDFDADIELDVAAGYWLELSESLGLDLSATYYVYPSEPGSNYAEASAVLERSAGPTTLRAGFSYVPRQAGTRNENGRLRDNSYLFAGASYQLSDLPLTLRAEVGHERGYFDEVRRGGKWDWSLGGTFAVEKMRLGLAYSGTDAGREALVASFFIDF